MRMPQTVAVLAAAILFGSCRKPVEQPVPVVAKRVREPVVAGQFYPGTASELKTTVQGFLERAQRLAQAPVPMVLVPHAGYVYSGQVAAQAFRQLEPGFERVVVIAANHSAEARYRGISVDRSTHYRVPGLEVPLSDPSALLKNPLFVEVPAAHGSHVVELELPFLAELNGKGFELLPLIVSRLDRSEARAAAEVLAAHADAKTRFVFSVDLSHYHPYEMAERKDRSCLDALARMNADDVAQCDTDGTQVLLLMTELAARLALTPKLVTYANSGDVSGDRSRVVGYGALVYEDRFELNAEERNALLLIARTSLETRVREGKDLAVPPELVSRHPRLETRRGAFVTLKKDGDLRGCIGTLTAHRPLAEDVAANAVNAALHDPRFSPVAPEELSALKLSISVLDAPRPLSGVAGENLVALLGQKKPGLILEYRGRRSTFLPEVWEQLPEPVQFLGHLCRKQGSPEDCWRSEEARFETYGSQHLEVP